MILSVIDSFVIAFIFVRSFGGNKFDIKEYVNGVVLFIVIFVSVCN